jgi:ubiquinone/menaquinone biosynthesis C-methylase UbiE
MTGARLAMRALRLAITGTKSDPIADYDAASTDYDSFFSRVMGRHSLAALDRVTVRPGDTVVELACGTGHLTAAIRDRLRGRGAILAVDKSAGMLDVARKKVTGTGQLRVSFAEEDMERFLHTLPSGSADLVLCGWAICYGKPSSLLRQALRVLRPGGELLVIETRADALRTLATTLERVFNDDPSLLTALIRVSLPKNSRAVARWFDKAGFAVTHMDEGEQVLPVSTPESVLDWVQRSGAAAGFKNAIAPDREAEVVDRLRAELTRQLGKTGELELRHTFVVVAGRKPQAG